MRIEPGKNSVPTPAAKPVARPSTGSSPSGAVRGNAAAAVDTQSINVVLQLVTNTSEIRESVVNDIKAQIQNGEYLAKQDAYETASSILNL
jgi:anti-sigma28 factor (negative regulator of flagellin synthesis)